jgi:hypothetical protein
MEPGRPPPGRTAAKAPTRALLTIARTIAQRLGRSSRPSPRWLGDSTSGLDSVRPFGLADARSASSSGISERLAPEQLVNTAASLAAPRRSSLDTTAIGAPALPLPFVVLTPVEEADGRCPMQDLRDGNARSATVSSSTGAVSSSPRGRGIREWENREPQLASDRNRRSLLFALARAPGGRSTQRAVATALGITKVKARQWLRSAAAEGLVGEAIDDSRSAPGRRLFWITEPKGAAELARLQRRS